MTSWNDLIYLRISRSANDRAWDYFLPLFIAFTVSADTSLSTTALLLAVRCVAGIVLVPLFTNLWTPKRALTYAIIENLSLIASGLALYRFNGTNLHILYLASVFMAIESATSKTLTSVIEKHQTVLQSQNDIDLSKANASLVRIDLIVAACIPFLVNYLLVHFGHQSCIAFLIGLQLINATLSLPTSLRVARQSSRTRTTEGLFSHSINPINNKKEDNNTKLDQSKSSTSFSFSFATLLHQSKSCYLILIANALLYFTVISPNGIMLVFLKNNGLDSFWIASVSSLGQVAGVVGSYLAPLVIEKLGLHNAALVLLTGQIVCVGGVAAVIMFYSQLNSVILSTICILTIFSRVGLWGIDLALRQMIQKSTDHNSRIPMFGMADSMAQCVGLCLYGIVSTNSCTFSSLTLASTLSLSVAWCCIFNQT